MKIEIDNDEVKTRNFEKDGKSYTFFEQLAWAHLENEKYPTQFKLQLRDGNGCKIGFYSVGTGSFSINKFGNLELKRFLVLNKI